MRTNRTDVIYFVQWTGRIGISLTQNIQLLSIFSFADTQREWKYTSTPVFSSFQNMSLQMPFLSSNNHHHNYLLLRLHFNHHYHRHGYLQHIKFVHKGHSSFLFVFDLLTDYSNKFKRSFVHHFVQVDWIFTMKRNLKNPLSIGWFILIAIVYIISSNSWVTQTYFQCATFYFTTTRTLTRQFSWNKKFMKKIRVLSR